MRELALGYGIEAPRNLKDCERAFEIMKGRCERWEALAKEMGKCEEAMFFKNM